MVLALDLGCLSLWIKFWVMFILFPHWSPILLASFVKKTVLFLLNSLDIFNWPYNAGLLYSILFHWSMFILMLILCCLPIHKHGLYLHLTYKNNIYQLWLGHFIVEACIYFVKFILKCFLFFDATINGLLKLLFFFALSAK